MKTYFLQKGRDGREFIDDCVHVDAEEIQAVEAASWEAAKEAFSLPQ